MEGVTILNQSPIMVYSTESKILFVIFCLLLSVFAFLCWVKCFGKCKVRNRNLIGLFTAMIIFGISCAVSPKDDTDRNVYSVVVSNKCGAKDFCNAFDVISQDGDLWVVQDKEK